MPVLPLLAGPSLSTASTAQALNSFWQLCKFKSTAPPPPPHQCLDEPFSTQMKWRLFVRTFYQYTIHSNNNNKKEREKKTRTKKDFFLTPPPTQNNKNRAVVCFDHRNACQIEYDPWSHKQLISFFQRRRRKTGEAKCKTVQKISQTLGPVQLWQSHRPSFATVWSSHLLQLIIESVSSWCDTQHVVTRNSCTKEK